MKLLQIVQHHAFFITQCRVNRNPSSAASEVLTFIFTKNTRQYDMPELNRDNDSLPSVLSKTVAVYVYSRQTWLLMPELSIALTYHVPHTSIVHQHFTEYGTNDKQTHTHNMSRTNQTCVHYVTKLLNLD